MGNNANSNVRAGAWLKPDQVEELRNAVFRCRPTYLQGRDDTIIATLYDTGLRVGELVALNVDHLRDNNTVLFLPTELQKDYPTDASPKPTRIALDDEVARTLSKYLANRWKDTEALFPSRSSPRITKNSVRRMIEKVAVEAEIKPYLDDGTRGDPSDVTPHTLRHSVAYRMLSAENRTIYEVKNRLRHRSVNTTEKIYAHFDTV